MIVLDSGDKIQGDAAAATVVDYSIYGLDNNVLKQMADGQLPVSIGDLYTADSVDVASTIVLVNTDSVERAVNLYMTPSAGTARRLIPKDMVLGVGYSLNWSGDKMTVLNTSGQIISSTTLSAHKDSHDPNDGSDPLDTAAAAEISAVVAAGAGTSHSLARADHVHAINHGITDNHIVTVDQADAASGELTRLTANGLESRSDAEVKAQLAYLTDLVDDTAPELGGSLTVGEYAVQLDASLSADGKYSGVTCDGVIGYASAAFGDPVYLANADDRWEKTDANAVATAGDVMLGLVVSSGASDGDACVILLYGFMREDDWDFTSGGDALYVSETPGAMTATAPSTASAVVRVVGYAGQNADTVFFNPSKSWVEIAA